jgi:hypothetical protein
MKALYLVQALLAKMENLLCLKTLKELMQKEMEQLPDTLNKIEPVQRAGLYCVVAFRYKK